MIMVSGIYAGILFLNPDAPTFSEMPKMPVTGVLDGILILIFLYILCGVIAPRVGGYRVVWPFNGLSYEKQD
jgi:hypothetical protein